MSDWAVRPATRDDMDSVVRVRLDGWRSAYAHVMSDDVFAGLEAMRDIEVERRRERFGAPGKVEWVGTVGDEVVGWALAGPGTDDPAPTPLELWGLYVDVALHGSGMAGALVRGVLGDAAASLWVLEDNPRARAFYSRQGFVADGARKMLDGELSHIPEIRMVRTARDISFDTPTLPGAD